MTQEEKQLLLKDLCARLSYSTFAQWHHKALNTFRDVKIMKISTYGKNIDDYYINVLCQPEPEVDYEASIVDIKPYLRLISNMTRGEKEEFEQIRYNAEAKLFNAFSKGGFTLAFHEINDWLNAHHFDYRGLIPMKLALEAPKGMYNIKEK